MAGRSTRTKINMPKGPNYQPKSGKRPPCGLDHTWVTESSPFVDLGNHQQCKYCPQTRTLVGNRIIMNHKPEVIVVS